MEYKNNKEWFEHGYVFDLETGKLINYKTRDTALCGKVPHYLYGEDGTCFKFEDEITPRLNKCYSKTGIWPFRKEVFNFPTGWMTGSDEERYCFVVRGNKLSGDFFSSADEYVFDRNCSWMWVEDYFNITSPWYDAPPYNKDDDFTIYDLANHMFPVDDIFEKMARNARLAKITWMHR